MPTLVTYGCALPWTSALNSAALSASSSMPPTRSWMLRSGLPISRSASAISVLSRVPLLSLSIFWNAASISASVMDPKPKAPPKLSAKNAVKCPTTGVSWTEGAATGFTRALKASKSSSFVPTESVIFLMSASFTLKPRSATAISLASSFPLLSVSSATNFSFSWLSLRPPKAAPKAVPMKLQARPVRRFSVAPVKAPSTGTSWIFLRFGRGTL
mmetsp:Transcript_107223/g.313530  ORF Transcript_107223/g.313530 Transcript_107223/m.313530 type:complete len:214 (-) Transcript_107223:422-1063(-)